VTIDVSQFVNIVVYSLCIYKAVRFFMSILNIITLFCNLFQFKNCLTIIKSRLFSPLNDYLVERLFVAFIWFKTVYSEVEWLLYIEMFMAHIERFSQGNNISIEKIFVITDVCTHVPFIRSSKHQRILLSLKKALKTRLNWIFRFSQWFCCKKTMLDESEIFRLRSCQKFHQWD